MGTVVGLPLKPDLGEIKSVDHPDEGTLLNVAGIVEMCRTSRSDRARKVYREFLKAWDLVRTGEGHELDKQFAALQEAFATIGMNVKESWQSA